MKLAARPGFAAWLLGVALAGSLAGPALAADTDAFLGTWLLNPAKSKVPQGAMPSSSTLIVSDAGAGKFKNVTDTSMAGQSMHVEVTFAIDGKDYTPVTTPALPPGTPAIVQAYERVSAKVYKTSVKVAGQVVAASLNEVSADGKTLTVTTTGVGPAAGVTMTMVFDKK